MKKGFVLAAACCLLAVSAAFVSCDPNKAQCWRLVVTYPNDQSQEYYFYGTGVEADAQLEIYHQAGATKVHREQTFLSKDNCRK